MANILASDINTIRQKVADVLGTGATTFGYGQNIYSSAITSGTIIQKVQWDAVRFDIVNCYIHQTGNIPSAITVSTSDTITDDASGAYQNYDYFADVLTNNRFDVATGQFAISAIDTKTTSSTWNTNASSELTINFADATQGRYFFNSGGAIRISSTLTGGTSSQANAWTNLLDSVGEQDFVGDLVASNGYYTLTDSYQTYFSRAASTPYSANLYQLKAKCDVADNSAGTATQVTIKIELSDSYVDLGPPTPGDLVDGTLTIVAEELKATGTLQPTGDPFTVSGPTSYSMSAISLT
jgi:hypothetical protein